MVESRIVNFNDIKIDENKLLGSGGFGSVYIGSLFKTKCAVKVPNKENDKPLSKSDIEDFISEVVKMSSIGHPNLTIFMGACFNPEIRLASELLETDLNVYLYKPEKIPKSLLIDGKERPYNLDLQMKIIRDICKGVSYLHGLNIIHRDLKPANFLISRDFTIKVSDFGLSILQKDALKEDKLKGTLVYLPIECFLDKPIITFKMDIYALGFIFAEILTRETIFNNITEQKFLDLIKGDLRPNLKKIPKYFHDLLKKMWGINPLERPNMDSVIQQIEDSYFRTILDDDVDFALFKGIFLNEETNLYENSVDSDILCDYLSMLLHSDIKSDHIKLLFDETESISFEKFKELLQFGKFYKDPKVFNEIINLFSAKWYEGKIDRIKAESLLKKDRVDKSFLVRYDPKKVTGQFTLSYFSHNTITHTQINREKKSSKEEKYSIIIKNKKTYFPTINSIIDLLIEKQLITTPVRCVKSKKCCEQENNYGSVC